MSKETLNLNGNLHVRISFLESLGLSPDAINNRLSENRKGKTRYYEHFKDPNDKRISWIKYESIPPSTRRKYNLPIPEQILQDVEIEKREEIIGLIRSCLFQAYEKDYIHFVKHYRGTFHDFEIIDEHARTHAVFHSCADLKRFGIPVKEIYPIYTELEGLLFPGKSLKSFYHKLADFEKRGVLSLIHGSQGKKKSVSKIHPDQEKQIEKLFRDAKMLSGPEITERLNFWSLRNGYKHLSVSTVRRVIADPVFQNKNRAYRNGVEWVKNNFEPFRLRLDADFQGEQWQIDGSRLQIPYLCEKTKKPTFVHLFVVQDAQSRKVIGYSVDKSENHKMVLRAIKMAVENCNYFPRQILRDNGSCFKKGQLKYILQFATYMGCEDRAHKPTNARDKGLVERLIGVFQSKVLKHIDGYVGEGIRSKRKEARPQEAVLKRNFNPKFLRSKQELEKLVPELIEQYNNLKSPKDNLSPNLRFEIAKTDKRIVPVSDSNFRLLFWERKMKQIKNSMIILSEGSHRNKQFQYIIDDEDLRYRLNLTEVLVCYNRKDRSIIALFDKNENWIVNLKLTKPIKRVWDSTKERPTEKPILDNSLRDKAKKSKESKVSRNQLYKQPATLDVLLVKTKEND